MHSPHSSLLVAEQRIADLHRAADHYRLAHSTIDARPARADAPAKFVRRVRRRLTHPLAASR